MNKVEDLENKLASQEVFIKNILTELSEVYDLVGQLKAQAGVLNIEFKNFLKGINHNG